LNVRSAPSISSPVIHILPQGVSVAILRYEPAPTQNAPRGWYQVQLASGAIGFASAEHITKA